MSKELRERLTKVIEEAPCDVVIYDAAGFPGGPFTSHWRCKRCGVYGVEQKFTPFDRCRWKRRVLEEKG